MEPQAGNDLIYKQPAIFFPWDLTDIESQDGGFAATVETNLMRGGWFGGEGGFLDGGLKGAVQSEWWKEMRRRRWALDTLL
ncbi:hypothetical protein Tco_0633731 [Tanacetum coccineum]